MKKEIKQEIINDWKQLIEEFTHEKFSKIADNSATVAIHYYGNTTKEDYSFYLNNSYLAFQNYYTHFDIWIDDIFSIELYDSELHILTKNKGRTSMFKILNTQVGK
jgi:hypothetical protein